MTRSQKMSAPEIAFKCLRIAAWSEQDGDREKAEQWRKEASNCFRIASWNLRYNGKTKTGRFSADADNELK